MATDPNRVPTAAAPVSTGASGSVSEPSLGELFKQLAQDSATLVRQEVALAKVELRENVQGLAKAVAVMAVGGVALLIAFLALNIFLIWLLGDLLGDRVWLGALIVTVVYGILGAVLLASGKKKLQQADLKPDETLRSLQADKRWAQSEVQQVKRELQS
mgnify:CR=1 FL=1